MRISEGVITANGATITGKITSTEGAIGGFTIKNGYLYKGLDDLTKTTQGVYLGTTGIRVNGSNTNVYTKISGGVIEAKGANITGTINATAGYIGTNPGDTDYRIFIGDRQVNQSTLVPCIYWNITSPSDTTHTSGFYLGYDGIRLGSGFKADSSGNVFVNAAYIGTSSTVENRIYIGNTTVAGDATSPCIRYKITSFSDTTHTAGFYLGSDGLRIGKIYVDSQGNTNISGATHATTKHNFIISNGGSSKTTESSISYNKETLDANTDGIYVGTDGIALGAKTSTMTHSPFEVDAEGNLYATSATISGTLTAGSGSKIKAGSSIGNWIVDSTGYLKNNANNPTVSLSPSDLTRSETQGGKTLTWDDIGVQVGSTWIAQRGVRAGAYFVAFGIECIDWTIEGISVGDVANGSKFRFNSNNIYMDIHGGNTVCLSDVITADEDDDIGVTCDYLTTGYLTTESLGTNTLTVSDIDFLSYGDDGVTLSTKNYNNKQDIIVFGKDGRVRFQKSGSSAERAADPGYDFAGIPHCVATLNSPHPQGATNEFGNGGNIM